MGIYLLETEPKALEWLLEQMGFPIVAVTYAWNGQQSPYCSVKGFHDSQWLFEKPEWGQFARSRGLAGQQDFQGFWTGPLCIHQAQWVNPAEQTLEQIRTCNHRTHVCVMILPENERPDEGPYHLNACQSGCKAILFEGPVVFSMDSLSRSRLQLSLDYSRNEANRQDLVSQYLQAAKYSVQQLSESGQQQHDQALRSPCTLPCIGCPRVLLIVSHDTGKAIADAFPNASECPFPDYSMQPFIRGAHDCPASTQQTPNAVESIKSTSAGFARAERIHHRDGITQTGLPGLPHPTRGHDLPHNIPSNKSNIRLSAPITHNDNFNEVELYHNQARISNAETTDRMNDSEPQSCTIRWWLNSQDQGSDTSTEPGGVFFEGSPPIEQVQSSSSPIHDNKSSSDCSNSSEDEWASFDEWTQTHPSLKTGHALLGIKGQLVQAAIEQYKQQRGATDRTNIDAADMLTAEKNRCQPTEDSVEEPSKSELACPFYKANPVKYARCLKFSRLNNISQVKEHLVQQHRLPFYCPVCKKDFQTARARDQHIIRRTCSLQHGFPFEGVSDDQRRLLARQHKRRDRRQQWRKICELLDLQSVVSESPHVKDAVGKEVVQFKDFWRKHGQLCVAESLRGADVSNWDRQNEEQDLACLYSEVFFGALDIISQRNSETPVVLGSLPDRTL